MGRSLNPKNEVIPGFGVTAEQKAEIRRRADAARLTVAEYVRDRALGKACSPVEVAEPEPAPRKRKAS